MKPTKNEDTEMLDWLQEQCGGVFSCRQIYDPFVSSPAYKGVWELFTIPSQHVTGISVRNAIYNAMKKVKEGEQNEQ